MSDFKVGDRFEWIGVSGAYWKTGDVGAVTSVDSRGHCAMETNGAPVGSLWAPFDGYPWRRLPPEPAQAKQYVGACCRDGCAENVVSDVPVVPPYCARHTLPRVVTDPAELRPGCRVRVTNEGEFTVTRTDDGGGWWCEGRSSERGRSFLYLTESVYRLGRVTLLSEPEGEAPAEPTPDHAFTDPYLRYSRTGVRHCVRCGHGEDTKDQPCDPTWLHGLSVRAYLDELHAEAMEQRQVERETPRQPQPEPYEGPLTGARGLVCPHVRRWR